MAKKNTVPVHITGVSELTHAAVKQEAAKRRVLMNELWLKIINSGCKRLKIEIGEEKSGIRACSDTQ